MVRIILLADQERLIRLFNDPGTLPGAKVVVASAVEDALAAISAEAPRYVFVQERIGEVAGEMLVHRLVDDLRGRRGRVVLIGDPSRATAKSATLFIDASLDDHQLAEAVRRTLTATRPAEERRRAVRRKQPVRGEAAAPAEASAPPIPTETVADVVTIGARGDSFSGAADDRQTAPTAGSPPAAGSSFALHLENALEAAPSPEPEADLRAELPAAGPAGQPVGPAPESSGRPSLLSRVLNHAPGSRKSAIALLSLTAVALILLAVINSPEQREGSIPVAENRQGNGTAAVPAAGLRALPSFIPARSRDAAYGAVHPGWERYQTPGIEYRVYRDKGAIRAIQVIDRGKAGIAPGLFEAALKEVAGSSRYLVESAGRKGAYLIEKGRLQNGAGLIVYRRDPERRIRAFVLDLRS